MADTTDYLLEAAFGVLQGGKNAYLPFKQAEYEDELTRRREERAEKRKRIPVQRVEALSGVDIPTLGSGLPEEQYVMPDELSIVKQQETFKNQLNRENRADERLNLRLKGQEDRMQTMFNQQEKNAIVRETIKDLPKLRESAILNRTNLSSINTALELTEKGVTGKSGQLKAFLAPYAEAVGVYSDKLSDAQKFQLLTRSIVGPMRLEIIGPGPVSEWEQKLMQQLSGSGGAAKAAAKTLLNRYKQLSKEKILNYNNTLTGAIEMSPGLGKIYQPIEIEDGLPSLVDTIPDIPKEVFPKTKKTGVTSRGLKYTVEE